MRKIKLVLSLFTFMNLLQAQPETTTNPGPSNPMLCSLGELSINEFCGGKTLKVVIGLPFSFRGMHTPLDEPYHWELGHGNITTFMSYWPLTPAPSLLTGQTTISTLALPINNSDFGETHGVVRLKSHSNATKLSTDPPLNKKVQVFYKKDDPNKWNPLEPNWSFYWKQVVDKDNIETLNFEIDMLSRCGSPTAIACIPNRSLNKKDCYYRQVSSEESLFNTGNTGINCFIETLAHENQHLILWKFFWPDGYKSGPDDDFDGDQYPNWFEKSLEGISAGFDWTKDINCYNCKVEKTPTNKLGWSVGKIYEEAICIDVQKHANVNQKDGLDWSFDPLGVFHGKRWKY